MQYMKAVIKQGYIVLLLYLGQVEQAYYFKSVSMPPVEWVVGNSRYVLPVF